MRKNYLLLPQKNIERNYAQLITYLQNRGINQQMKWNKYYL